MILKLRRITEVRCPFQIVAEGAVDWTHFSYIHRKSHRVFKLIKKDGFESVFYYKARMLYPFPIYKNYILVRRELPTQWGYEQVYYDLSTGKTHFLKAVTVENGETNSIVGDFEFDVSTIWMRFPKLFFFIFKLRMRRVMNEDNMYMKERMHLGVSKQVNCEIKVPETYSLFADYRKENPEENRIDFQDHVLVDLTK